MKQNAHINGEIRNQVDRKKITLFFAILFLIGAWLRSIELWRPVDGRINELWRECDYASIARNYYKEDMNILYPRIDWRGDGPGFAEMEFPIFPWTVSVMYKVFGYKELLGRLLSFIISLVSLLVFFRLAKYLLHPISALIASLLFILNPLAIRISTSLQPEGLMLVFYMFAVYTFVRWLDEGNPKLYGFAVISTAAAILVKANAAHIGFLFLALLIHQKGIKSLRHFSTWLFPVLALSPAVIWYLHAHSMWLTFGNSLGVSNEYHWIGWDFFKNPGFIYRLGRIELFNVWGLFGGIVAGLVILKKNKDKAVRLCFFWIMAIFIYYIVTIRTSADYWAYYYHIVTVPAAALLLGAGFDLVRKYIERQKYLNILMIVSTSISLTFILLNIMNFMNFSVAFLLSVIISFFLTFFTLSLDHKLRHDFSVKLKSFPILILFGIFSTLLFYGLKTSRDLNAPSFQAKYICAESFKKYIPEKVLIIVSGGTMIDDTGYPVAYNAPYYFFWLNRKGFNIPIQQQSMKKVNEMIDRGAKYYVLEKTAARFSKGYKEQLEEEFTILKECQDAYLILLTKSGTQSPLKMNN